MYMYDYEYEDNFDEQDIYYDDDYPPCITRDYADYIYTQHFDGRAYKEEEY